MPKHDTRTLIRGFYGIVDVADGRPDPLEAAAAMARGGARCVRLRCKSHDPRHLKMIARGLREISRIMGVCLIIDDSAELAAEVKADGVHVGQGDLSCADARRIVGPDTLVGVSTHNDDQLLAAIAAGADYVGYGPVFAEHTKDHRDPAVGVEGLARAVALSAVPIVAIGGITLKTARAVTSTGVHALASIEAVYNSGDLLAAAASFSSFFPD